MKIHFIACKPPVQKTNGMIRLSSFSGEDALIMSYDPKVFLVKTEEQLVEDGSLKAIWGKTVYRVSLETKRLKSKGTHTIKFEKAE